MKKIMFAMLRTLGDVMVGTTICRELKKDYPDSEIHFYTNHPYSQLLKNNPDIHTVHASDDWVLDMLFVDIAHKDFDIEYLPYQVRGDCNIWHQREETRHQHLVDFYWQRMGMHRQIKDRECYLFPSPEDYEKAAARLTFEVPRIAIHAQSGVPTKDWPYFTELVDELRKLGYGTVQVGAKTDKRIEGTVDFRGQMDFPELAAFLSKCAVFVGLDSGLSYMADAMKIPTIVIQGSTNPTTSGPISDRVIHLFVAETGYADCQEVRCHMTCRHEKNCIEKITVPMVLEKIDLALSDWKAPIPAGV